MPTNRQIKQRATIKQYTITNKEVIIEKHETMSKYDALYEALSAFKDIQIYTHQDTYRCVFVSEELTKVEDALQLVSNLYEALDAMNK